MIMGINRDLDAQPMLLSENEETRPLLGREGVRARAFLGRVEELAGMQGEEIWRVLQEVAGNEEKIQDEAFLKKVIRTLKIFCVLKVGKDPQAGQFGRDPQGLEFMMKEQPDKRMTDYVRKTAFAFLLKKFCQHDGEDKEGYDFFHQVFKNAFMTKENGFVEALALIQAGVRHETGAEANENLINNIRLLLGEEDVQAVEVTAEVVENICRETEKIFKEDELSDEIAKLRKLKKVFSKVDPISTKRPTLVEARLFVKDYEDDDKRQKYDRHYYKFLIDHLTELLEDFCFDENVPTLTTVAVSDEV